MESSVMFIMKRRLNFGILVKLDSAFPDAYCHFKIFDRLEKNPIGTMPQQKAPFQLELCHNRRHHFKWNYVTTEGTISIGTMPQQKAPFQLELCHNKRHHFNWNHATTEGTISGKIQVLTCILAIRKWS